MRISTVPFIQIFVIIQPVEELLPDEGLQGRRITPINRLSYVGCSRYTEPPQSTEFLNCLSETILHMPCKIVKEENEMVQIRDEGLKCSLCPLYTERRVGPGILLKVDVDVRMPGRFLHCTNSQTQPPEYDCYPRLISFWAEAYLQSTEAFTVSSVWLSRPNPLLPVPLCSTVDLFIRHGYLPSKR